MKIYHDTRNIHKALSNVLPGECFEESGVFWIKSDEPGNDLVYAVNLETGENKAFWDNEVVHVVEAKLTVYDPFYREEEKIEAD